MVKRMRVMDWSGRQNARLDVMRLGVLRLGGQWRAAWLFPFLLLLAAVPRPARSAECQTLPPTVEHFIRAFTQEHGGSEDCQFRQSARGNIDDDGADDFVVVFRVDGACRADQTAASGACKAESKAYLKTFLGKQLKEGPILALGGPGEREIKSLRIDDGAIIAKVLKHRQPDNQGPPSIESQSRFTLQSGAIVEEEDFR